VDESHDVCPATERLLAPRSWPSASKPPIGWADLKVQQANVEGQRARITAVAGAALCLAKLFGSDDTEAMARVPCCSSWGWIRWRCCWQRRGDDPSAEISRRPIEMATLPPSQSVLNGSASTLPLSSARKVFTIACRRFASSSMPIQRNFWTSREHSRVASSFFAA
jgi:hypothetical protein